MITAVRFTPASDTCAGGERAAQDDLVELRGAGDDGDRPVFAVVLRQPWRELVDRLDGEVQDQGRAVGGERIELLAGRHRRRATGVAGEDHRLGDAGQRQLASERGGGGGEGGHAGGDVVGDGERVEAAHLLGGGDRKSVV